MARLSDDAKGLRLSGTIETDLPDGKLAHAQALKKMLKGLSIGYRTVKEMWDDAAKAYRLYEVKLFEASMVTIPANPLTLIESVKSDAELLARATEDIKAGRTLSAATRKRLESAVLDIQALLAEADAMDEAAEGDKNAAANEPLLHSLRGLTAILRA
jgi:phage head maturation protease